MPQKWYQKPSNHHIFYITMILRLQKFKDVLKNRKKRIIYKDERDEVLSLIRQPKKNKKKTIIMRFKVNIEENNLIKQKNQKKVKKGITKSIKM